MCNSCQEIKLRDTPATKRELAKMRRHRLAGTAPAMPAWYWAHVRAHSGAPWRAGAAGRSVDWLIAERRRIQNAPQAFYFPSARVVSTPEYVREFAQLNYLTP